MLVRFRYSGRSSVSHYCLTRRYFVSLTCVPSAMSIGKRVRASKISRTASLWLLWVLEAVVERSSDGGVSASEPSFQLPLISDKVAALAQG